MTPKQRLDILLADDGSQHAQAAVEWLQNISLPPKVEYSCSVPFIEAVSNGNWSIIQNVRSWS